MTQTITILSVFFIVLIAELVGTLITLTVHDARQKKRAAGCVHHASGLTGTKYPHSRLYQNPMDYQNYRGYLSSQGLIPQNLKQSMAVYNLDLKGTQTIVLCNPRYSLQLNETTKMILNDSDIDGDMADRFMTLNLLVQKHSHEILDILGKVYSQEVITLFSKTGDALPFVDFKLQNYEGGYELSILFKGEIIGRILSGKSNENNLTP